MLEGVQCACFCRLLLNLNVQSDSLCSVHALFRGVSWGGSLPGFEHAKGFHYLTAQKNKTPAKPNCCQGLTGVLGQAV